MFMKERSKDKNGKTNGMSNDTDMCANVRPENPGQPKDEWPLSTSKNPDDFE